MLLAVFVIRSARGGQRRETLSIKPGERVATLEAVLAGEQPPPPAPGQAPTAALGNGPPDASINIRDRARALVEADPGRAALLLRAWISSDEVANG